MAIETNNVQSQAQSNNANGKERKQADAFLNLKVIDKHGNPHNIKCTIPLYADDRVHAALMRKGADGVEIEIVGSVNIVDKSTDDIEL